MKNKDLYAKKLLDLCVKMGWVRSNLLDSQAEPECGTPPAKVRAPKEDRMKEFVAVIFGLGLLCNALLFVPQAIAVWRKKSDEGISLITFGGFSVLQAIGIVHGVYQRDLSLILGMAASLLSCGTVTLLTIYYRVRRRRGEVKP
jgi:MtN3 and saliva related transmembrane protein